MSIYDKASLVLIPSGTKTSKVYSQKPVNGDGDFTFSRSTAATRVNADGNIEKETQNLVTHSGDLTQWTSANAGTRTATTDPLGGNKAFILNDQDAAAYYRVESNALSITGVVTGSIYIKKTTGALSNYAGIEISATAVYIIIDTTNGTYNLSGTSPYVDVKIESAYSGWWRVSCVVSNYTSGTFFGLWPAISSNGTSIASGAQGSNIFYAPQIEQGLAARDYIETTTAAVEGGITDNVPRLDYTDSSCPALLLEPQRTNLFTYSEYIGGWSTSNTGVTIEENSTTSPEGVNNAAKIKEDGTNAAHAVRQLTGPTLTSGTDYTFSFFAKKGERNIVALSNTIGASNDANCFFDLENGEVLTNQFNSASIEDYGNGWFRCIVTDSADAADDYDTRIYTATADNQFSHQGVLGSGLYIFGLQLEAGSYATSYIPTYGTSVTRNGELSTQVENFTDLPTSYPFAIYSEPYLTNAIGNGAWAFYENSHQYSYYSLRITSQGKFNMLSRPQGVTQNEVNSTSTYSEGFHKVLCVYENETTIKIYVNGALEGTNSNCTNNSFKSDANDFLLGMFRGIETNPCSIKQFMVFNNSLTDQEAIDLTTI